MLKLHRLTLALVLLVLAVCASTSVWAQGDNGPLILNDPQSSYPLGLHLEYLEDPGGSLNIEDVSGPEYVARFTPNTEKNPNFGLTSSAYWIRFQVRNETSRVYSWRLSSTDARLGLIDLYYMPQGGTGWIHQQAGRFRPSTVREYVHPYFVFPLDISPSNEGTVYLRLQSNIPIRFSLSLWPEELFERTNQVFFLILGLFYGIVIVMAVYNLMIFLFLKKPIYLYYFGFISVVGLNAACIDGVAYAILFPNWAHPYTLLITISLGTVFAVPFICDFLELKIRVPWMNRTLIYAAVLTGMLLVPYFFHFSALEKIAYLGLANSSPLIAFLAIAGALITWRQGLSAARYFLLGWLGLLSNIIFRNFSVLGFIPSYPLYDWTYYLSIVLMVVFLSLALADQINVLRTQAFQAEQAKRVSEDRFRLLYEHAPMGIFFTSPSGRIEQANRALQELFGYSEQELRNRQYLELFQPDERAFAYQNFGEVIEGEKAFFEGTIQGIRKDGRPLWLWRSASALYDNAGKISQGFWMMTDITERTEVEKKIRESEERFRLAIESAPNAILLLDPQGTIVLANSRAEHDFQYSREELIGKNVDMLVPQRRQKIHADYRSSYFLNPQNFQVGVGRELYGLRKDGSEFPAEVRLASITTDDGRLVMVTVVDITERKRAEDALNESELKYRTLVEQANAGIIVLQDGKIIFANSFAEELSGYSSEELLNTPFINYLVEDERPRMLDLYQRRMAGEDVPGVYETAFNHKDGSRLDVEINAGITLYEGQPSDMVFVRDITERKWMEAQGESALKALYESEQKYRTVVEQGTQGILVYQDGHRKYYNPTWLEMTGYSSEEYEAQPFLSIVYLDDLDGVKASYQKLFGQEYANIPDFRITTKSGDLKWLSVNAVIIEWEGKPAGMVFVEDITRRKLAEDALQKRKERYRQALESGRILLWQWDAATDYMEIDGAVDQLLGYAPDEIDTTAKQTALTPLEDQVMLGEAWGELLEGRKENYNVVHRFLHKNGSVIWVEAHGSVIKDEQGQVIGILGTSRDITATKQAEELVARSQSVGQVGSWELNLITNELTWSQEVYRIFGLDPESFVPTYDAFLEHVHPEDRVAVDATYSGSIQRGEDTYEIEHRLTRPAKGEIRWVLERCDHIRDESGQIVRSIGVVQDITERRRTEDALRQSQEQLALLNRSSQTINMTGLDREKVFTAIRAACAWLVPADVVAISLVDHVNGEIEDVFLMDRDRRLRGGRYALKDYCIADVLEDGITVRVDDFQTGPCWPGSPPDVRSGMAVQLRGSTETLGVLSVQSYVPNAYSEADRSVLESFAAHVSITLENIRRYKQLERTAVIEERQRLASELHDSVTQLLYSMAMMSNGWGLKASQDDLPDPADHFYQIEELSLQALKEMRVLLFQLRLPVLVEVGLLKALEDRLNKVERRVQVKAHLQVKGRFPTLSKVVEEEIYFIILEALNNSLRHARATAVQINIRTQGNQLHITVEDNGRGYDPSRSTSGMGMTIMRHRANNIEAKLEVDSQPRQGTRVELMVEI